MDVLWMILACTVALFVGRAAVKRRTIHVRAFAVYDAVLTREQIVAIYKAMKEL